MNFISQIIETDTQNIKLKSNWGWTDKRTTETTCNRFSLHLDLLFKQCSCKFQVNAVMDEYFIALTRQMNSATRRSQRPKKKTKKWINNNISKVLILSVCLYAVCSWSNMCRILRDEWSKVKRITWPYKLVIWILFWFHLYNRTWSLRYSRCCNLFDVIYRIIQHVFFVCSFLWDA